ncbi:MAG: PIN domain-containing protein [Pseudomonadota bacterium]
MFLSFLVLGEIRRGAERVRRRDPARARSIDAWLAAVTEGFANRILDVDRVVADEWGRIAALRPVPTVDALLAATATVHGLILATRNVADVKGTGAQIVNPFDPGSA